MKITIVGCGTTGNTIIPLLQEDLFLIDRDIVEEKNLARQILFSKKDIGKPKAEVLGKRLHYKYKNADLEYTNVSLLAAECVIDCTDNLETRFLINDYCHKNKIPWVYTGIVGAQARVMSIRGDFCFRCIFSEVKGLDTCTTRGVDMTCLKTLAQVVKEEVKNIREGRKSKGLWTNRGWIKVRRKEDCDVCCHKKYAYLDGKKEKLIKFCGSSRYQVKGNFDFENVKKRLHGKGNWFVYEDFYIFRDRILIKATSEKEAKKKCAEIIGV